MCSLALHAQRDSTSPGFLGQAVLQTKILQARHEFVNNNMRGALTIYREVLDASPGHAQALYGTALCHYNLKKYSLALNYLQRADSADASVSSELDYWYGLTYHRLAQLDKAIEYYRKYSARQLKISEDYRIAQEYIAQCIYAKEMMAQPVKVKIENLGDAINSRYDDYAPSITADGRSMVFTSRRSDTKGGKIDERGDYKFFEDIYYSQHDATSGRWSNAAGIEGNVNTETYDAVLSIAPNGKQLFIYRNTVNAAGDIYYSLLNEAEGSWSEPVKMPRPINTSYYEGSVSITADGNTLYFISEREGGYGRGDIYVSHRKGADKWSAPRNLGGIVNTSLDEKFVFIHPNGKTLYFSSEGHQTMGSYDIFKTELVNGEWSIPVNVGYPINTVNEESTFSLTRDNKTLLIAAEYDDSFGERDIYRIDVSAYPLIAQGYDQNTFAQLVVSLKDSKGKAVKGAEVAVSLASTGKPLTTKKTDKRGEVRVNLQGKVKYNVLVNYEPFSESRTIELIPDPSKEVDMQLDFKLK